MILGCLLLTGLCACGSGNEAPAAAENAAEKGAWSFFAHTYTDASGAEATMKYGLYIPASYDGTTALPLVTYIPDSSYVGGVIGKYAKGECPSAWINETNQKENPVFFLTIAFSKPAASVTDATSQAGQIVPIIDKVVSEYGIDENRLYLTGQSMGGIMDFALNDAYPDKFAATVYVGCQPGGEVHNEQYDAIVANAAFADQKFCYIASAKDGKAPYGQDDVMAALTEKGIAYGYLDSIDHLGGDTTEAAVQAVLDAGYTQNIFRFAQVTENGEPSQEHMQSFQYAYAIQTLYAWLMAQSK